MADSALEVLRTERAMLEQRVLALNQAIAALERSASDTGTVNVARDEYANMQVARAVEKFLLKHPRHTATMAEVQRVLEAGGAKLGAPDRHLRTLRVAVRMNSQKEKHPFVYDDRSETVKLRHAPRESKSA